VIGISDSLTVPFSLAAGLSGAIEMGLDGYMAVRTDPERFVSERAREERETEEIPKREAAEVADGLRLDGLEADKVETIVNSIKAVVFGFGQGQELS